MPIVYRYTLLVIGIHLATIGVFAQQKKSSPSGNKTPQVGVASFYGAKFQGKKMANGKPFDYNKLTAASNRLPLGTFVRVSNLRNKKSVIVEITDRMHRKNKRLIDVSREAARRLGFIGNGLAKVKVEIVARDKAIED